MRQHWKKIGGGGTKPTSKLTLKTKWHHSCGCCDDSRNCAQLKQRVLKSYTLKPNHLLLQYLSDWCLHGVHCDRNSGGKHLKLRDYLKQIEGHLVTLSALQYFGFFWTSAAKATRLQELAGLFTPRLSPDAQNRDFAKNISCIQILDKPLTMHHFFSILMNFVE